MWSDDTLAIFDKVRVEDKYSLYTSVHASTVYAGYVCVCVICRMCVCVIWRIRVCVSHFTLVRYTYVCVCVTLH
jgi:hypothetical protein